MEPLTQSSLERIAQSKNRSPAIVAAMVVVAYTFMAGAIFWRFSGRYSGTIAPQIHPSESRGIAQCQKGSLTTLADLSQCNKQPQRVTR